MRLWGLIEWTKLKINVRQSEQHLIWVLRLRV
jgi:hypothetical protein